MPPAASDQNSYPVHQGPDDEVKDPVRTGPTQDPRRTVAPSRLPSTLPLAITRLFHQEPASSQPTTFPTVPERLPPSTSASPTPTLPQPSHTTYPSRLAQLEAKALSPATNNSPPVFTTPTPKPQPVPIAHFESASSTPTKPPAGMHLERTVSLSVGDRPLSKFTPTQPPPHASLNDSQQHPPSEQLSVNPSRSLLTFPSGANAIALPRNGLIPSSSRVTLDDLVVSPVSGSPNPVSSPTYFESSNQRLPAHPHENPNRSSNQDRRDKAAQKRKAFEVSSPRPPKPPKMPKVEKGKSRHGNDTSGPVPAPVQGKALKKKKKKRGKGKANGQPGLSNADLRAEPSSQPLAHHPVPSIPTMASSSSSKKYVCLHQCGCRYSTINRNDLQRHISTVMEHRNCTPQCTYHMIW